MGTKTRLVTADMHHSDATCHGCTWTNNARNALATAVLHHDKTGHPVSVDIRRVVVYGDPLAPIPGQMTTADEETR